MLLVPSSAAASPVSFVWGPEATFYCLRLHCAGMRAHICCYRQVRKRRYKAKEMAQESLYPSCTPKCPQGALIRLAMPKGYEPVAYQKDHGLKRKWRVRGFQFPDSLPFGIEPFEGTPLIPDEKPYHTWGRGARGTKTWTCSYCGHPTRSHRGAYYGNCTAEGCDCPGWGGKF